MFRRPERKAAQLKQRPISVDGTPNVLVDTSFRATELHVRWAIGHALEKFGGLKIPADLQFTFEIVLAELLNNIVEHGYKNQKAGNIRLKVSAVEDRIRIESFDHGVQMPGLEAPHPPEPDLDVLREDLPEGSFGWFMIRKLVEDLEYKRDNGENQLSLYIRR